MPRKPLPIEPYIEKLEQAILIGATYELAAKYAGISDKTFHTWRKKSETAPDDSPLGQLRERLRQAEGKAAIGWLAKIEKAANEGNWTAAAWKLQKRYPEVYDRSFHKHAFTDATGERDGTLTLKVVYEDAIDVTPEVPLLEPPQC
jgi:transposase